MKWIIFDLDGTLSQTDLFMVPAIREAMEICGINMCNDDKIRATIGERVEETNLKFFGEKSCHAAEEFWGCVESLQNNKYADYMETYEGVEEMLDFVHESGYMTAVCSNAEISYIQDVLGKINILTKIDKIRPVIPGKEKTESLRVFLEENKPEFAIMVGDRIYDIDAARENDILSIGCLYGCGDWKELQDADFLVEKPEEISDILERIEKSK